MGNLSHVIGLLVVVYAATTPASTQNYTETSRPGDESSDGKCVCVVKSPSIACSESANYARLTQVSATVSSLSAEVSSYELVSLKAKLDSLSIKVTAFEASFSSQSVAVSVSQLSGLRTDISSVQALVHSVSANGTAGAKMELIKAELLAITKSLSAIRAQSPIAKNHDLEAQVASLRARLSNCKEGASTNHNFTRFIGDSLPLTKTIKNDRCHDLKAIHIGEPITHFWYGSITDGAWYKDPLPRKTEDKKKIYIMLYTAHSNDRLATYDNYSQLALKTTPHYSSYLGYRAGSGWVVYNGFLYFHDRYTVKKFDISINKVLQTAKFPAENADYLGGGTTYIDLHVDETGMFAVYKSNTLEKHLLISKINPNNMTIIKTWNTGKSKESIRSVFMVCGRMYAIDNHHRLYKNGGGADYYVFDTNSGKADRASIQVIQKYGVLRQVTYNPREGVLFGWDNQHLVTYPVTYEYNQIPTTQAPTTKAHPMIPN